MSSNKKKPQTISLSEMSLVVIAIKRTTNRATIVNVKCEVSSVRSDYACLVIDTSICMYIERSMVTCSKHLIHLEHCTEVYELHFRI